MVYITRATTAQVNVISLKIVKKINEIGNIFIKKLEGMRQRSLFDIRKQFPEFH